jgi:signal transduction histidine kinase
MFMLAAISPAAAEPKRVLLLHSFGSQFVPWVFFAGQFREELFKLSPDKIDLYEASLESSRFQEPEQQRPSVDYLASLFATRKLDLIVALGAPATHFVQTYRAQLFPSTPLVIGGPEQRAINYATLTANDAPVPVALDFRKWIANILEVLPHTTHIAWVVGASPLERFWTEEFRRTSQQFADRVTFEFFNDLRFEDMLDRVSKLPPHSAIFYVDLRVDAAGVPLDRDLVIPRLRQATNAPIFSYIDSYLGSGIVGGPMLSTEEVGRRMAQAAVRILHGEKPGDLKLAPVAMGAPQYDWRELQHWNIREDRLPAGSVVRFRELTAWKQYRWYISIAFAAILLQALLITGLLDERRRRRFAEIQSRQRLAELARANRFATAGELTASIAHEINQPLGAIQTNTETLDLVLRNPSPDLGEIKEIVADIRHDQYRASEVIRRLRSLLKKAPFEIRDIDLNDVVRENEKFLAAFSAMAVDVSTSLSSEPLPIRGDPVQLQQVVLNLTVNAIDAMSEIPWAERKVVIRTARVRNLAEVSISDAGPGIPPDKLKEVFEPFFTTKAHGMGMGLSIVRTIVEAHTGWIVAENQADGGAVFRVKFPLAKPHGNATDENVRAA